MTEEEILSEISIITMAIQAILNGGQSYTINSGGSTRQVTGADLNSLYTQRRNLYSELRDVQGLGGMNVSAGW
ncbi:MAG: hypothetical protein EOM15_10785 [Spirochaetia bacterium]|nr:hypothetical protein [Spirochaetia bacterium]